MTSGLKLGSIERHGSESTEVVIQASFSSSPNKTFTRGLNRYGPFVWFAWIGAVLATVTWKRNAELWFYWDELTWIEEISRGFSGLLSGHSGNFQPLGKALFWVFIKLFGGHYEYIGFFTVTLLVGGALVITYLVFLSGASVTVRLVVLTTMTTWLLSPGALQIATWGFMFIWILPVLIFLVATWLIVRREQSPWFLLVPVFLTFLIFSSLLIPLTIVSCALILWLRPRQRTAVSLRGPLAASVLIAVALALLATTLAGAIAPLDEGARIAQQPLDLWNLGETLATSWFMVPLLSLYWAVRPLWPFDFRQDRDGQDPFTLLDALTVPQLMGFAALAMLVVVTAILYLAAWRQSKLMFSALLPGALAIFALLAFVGLGYARWLVSDLGLTWLAFRYDVIGLLLGAVVITILVSRLPSSRTPRMVARAVGVFTTLTAVIALITVNDTAAGAVEPSRWSDRISLQEALVVCESGNQPQEVPTSIQSTYRDRLCDIFTLVR